MRHIPVLLSEAVDALVVRPGGRYIDGTLGRAGHTKEIIARGGLVLGIDRDDQALAESGKIENLKAVKGQHGNIKEIADENSWNEVDGVLLDLGVSSPQLDDAVRGFSFQREGPLDMRMDRAQGLTAADIVNKESAENLAWIFRTYSEERQAKKIANAIVRARERGRMFETTEDLASLVSSVIGRSGPHHPATRVFQALRMAVNDELGELERALEGALSLLRDGGRLAVITFESLSDRIVKRFFSSHVGVMRSLQQGGEEWCGTEPRARAVTKKPIVASDEECAANPRSRSAKLRVIEKGGGI
jgi:16S rRNA (cytosine1402-N4)-methyltransferase